MGDCREVRRSHLELQDYGSTVGCCRLAGYSSLFGPWNGDAYERAVLQSVTQRCRSRRSLILAPSNELGLSGVAVQPSDEAQKGLSFADRAVGDKPSSLIFYQNVE